MIGESGTVAPFVYYIGVGASNATTVHALYDPYGLTVTATHSGKTMTITFNVGVVSLVKIIG